MEINGEQQSQYHLRAWKGAWGAADPSELQARMDKWEEEGGPHFLSQGFWPTTGNRTTGDIQSWELPLLPRSQTPVPSHSLQNINFESQRCEYFKDMTVHRLGKMIVTVSWIDPGVGLSFLLCHSVFHISPVAFPNGGVFLFFVLRKEGKEGSRKEGGREGKKKVRKKGVLQTFPVSFLFKMQVECL